MNANATKPDHKDRTRAISVIGVVLLLIGIAAGLLGPLEMYCFALFSEGGRFHYEGFGFGTFMFGNIAGQIVGYYLIAALFIPLGCGHLKMRRWVRTLSLTLLWTWLVVGAPLTVVVFFTLTGTKDLSLPAALSALVFLGLSYLVFPGLLIRFYRGRNVRRTLETKDAKPHWIENIPIPILVLSALYLFYIIMLHILLLFKGMFPAFGAFRFGLQGFVLLDISMACLVCMIWGTLRQLLHIIHALQNRLFDYPRWAGISATGNGILGQTAVARLPLCPPGGNTASRHFGRGHSVETIFPDRQSGRESHCKD